MKKQLAIMKKVLRPSELMRNTITKRVLQVRRKREPHLLRMKTLTQPT